MNLDYLHARADLLHRLREFFRERGFLEVETPLTDKETIPERHIHLTQLTGVDCWLQASPEMHHKCMLCAGTGPLLEVTRSFRDGERGRHHRPEFTIVEWYRPNDTMLEGMKLLDDLVQTLLGAPPARRTSYREAFVSAVEVDPHNASDNVLARVAGLADSEDCDRDEMLNLILSKRVEPKLGVDAPEMLFHYPASQSALATTTTDEYGAAVAERFELYWRGVELANGYHELTDADELRCRLEKVNADRVEGGLPELPMPERLLEAMAGPGLPPCSGVALGFDRLVMLAVGAKDIGEVMAFSDPY